MFVAFCVAVLGVLLLKNGNVVLDRTERAAVELLKSSKLRTTRHRENILGCLLKHGRPLSHSEIQRELPSLDRVTLYRALSSFVNAGIVHKVQGPDGAWRFCAHNADDDGLGCPGDHPHFLCEACGKMICLVGQRLARLDVPDGYEVDGKQYVVYGKCSGCK